MDGAAGEEDTAALRVTFDPRLKLEFHGSKVTSDGGLLACRELDDALGLSETAGDILTDTRTGANGRHTLVGQFRQSVFGRLAGYEDVNDADRLAHDPAMRWVVGGVAVTGQAASTSQMGRFETEVMTEAKNLAALTDLSGHWIDRVHARRPVKGIVLDMDSSVSPTYGEQEGTAYNGHFGCQWALRLHLLPSSIRVQPVRRPGTVRLAPWQCPLRRGLAGGAGAGDRPLPNHHEAALLPSRCGFCRAGGLRTPGSGGLCLCHPAARQCSAPAPDRSPAQASGGPSAPRGPAFLRQLPLPGPDLEPLPPGRGQGRVASRRTLSPGGLSGERPMPSARAGGGLLQWTGHGGAVDPRGPPRREVAPSV